MSETTREVCVGCNHAIASHFNDVTGVARCLHRQESYWVSGASLGCACADFVDPNGAARAKAGAA